jgi:ATP-dependent RNA helicase RhlE
LSKFETLGLAENLLRAVRAEGYHTATPIQAQAIPMLLSGRDLMGCAQTGTGKTAAFALPTLQRLGTTAAVAKTAPQKSADDNMARYSADLYEGRRGPQRKRSNGRSANQRSSQGGDQRPIRSLILAPTRELAAQIGASFATYGKHTGMRCTVVYGGVGQDPQVRALQRGVDILVATPGRLLDLMEQGYIKLHQVEILILDEADQMLDMGFLPPLRRIVASVPRERQTLMFSATMPSEIRKLAGQWLSDPAHVQVAPVASPAELVEQSVFFVEPRHKTLLLTHFLQNTAFTRTLVFARTKHGADKIVKQLASSGIHAAALHGNKSQSVRQRTLAQFKSDRPPVLVATDIAARGLDVDGISHVINYELPQVPEIYVHRIGRTGRAGATGIATSFCGRDERGLLTQIERLTRRSLTVEQEQPEYPRDTSSGNGRSSGGGRQGFDQFSQRPTGLAAKRRKRPNGAKAAAGRKPGGAKPATAGNAATGNGATNNGGANGSASSQGATVAPNKRRRRYSGGKKRIIAHR